MGFLSFFRDMGRKVLGWGNTIRSGINKGYNFVKKIPVIGNLVDKGLNTPIPMLGGMSLGGIGSVASTALDVGNSINGGDYSGAVKSAGNLPAPSWMVNAVKRAQPAQTSAAPKPKFGLMPNPVTPWTGYKPRMAPGFGVD
jgi:hypothetical protein